jgi:hypothetical protein
MSYTYVSLNKAIKNILALLAFIFITFMYQISYADLYGSVAVPYEDAKFAEEYIAKLRNKEFSYVKNLMSKEILNQINDEKLNTMAEYFRNGELLSTELIGSQVNTFNSQWSGNFSFEYHFSTGWNLANVAYKKVDGKIEIIGLNVYKSDASQKEINKFALSGKSIPQYLILASAIIVPFFILVTLIFCIKTPIARRKWLWILFVLGGFGTISTNWTTAAFGYKIFQYQLLGAAAMASSEYSPWIITVGFPVGAIIFWFKRKSFIEQSKVNK